ncbi:hypothetical protein D3C81_1291140 [compost metagenome]
MRFITRQNDLRIAQQHRLHIHLRRRLGKVGEDIVRPAHSQGIAHHLSATERIQRPVPDLIEHLQGLLTPILLAQLPQPVTQGLGILAALFGTADTLGYGFDLLDQLVDVMGFATEGGDAQALELVALGGRYAAWPQQQQVGAQAEQALHVQLPLAPHRGQLAQRRRPLATVKYTHQQVVRLQLKHDFAHRGGQADHPRGFACQCGADEQRQQAWQQAHQPSWRGMR